MTLCMGCMEEIESEFPVCPECGFDNTQLQAGPFLPYETVLMDRYIIGNRIETNGESTKYIAFDKHEEKKVNIYEYLPIGLFERKAQQTIINILPSNIKTYNKIKIEFISYFKVIQWLNNFSAMMQVLDIFEENNTAYIVEERDDLIPFDEYLQRSNGHIEWDIARPLFLPVISALEALHKHNMGHYAVSPSNLYVTSSGKIKLFGFATKYERKRGTPLKSQLFSGCAAPEQYEDDFVLDISTDIYGFSATLFFALTGALPRNANERLGDNRLLMSTNTVKRLPPHVVTALANGLSVKRETRIKDFDDLRNQLSAAPAVQAIQEEISRTSSLTSNDTVKEARRPAVPSGTIFIISLFVSMIIFSVFGYLWYLQNPFKNIFNNSVQTETTAPEEPGWTGPVVSNYVDRPYEEILAETKNTNIQIYKSLEDEYSDTIQKGKVCSQSPPADTPITDENMENNTISIYIVVSKGSFMKELPDIASQTVSDVAKTLSELGLLVERVDEYSTSMGENRVIGYKDNQPGDKLEDGSTVKIRVSIGRETTAVIG